MTPRDWERVGAYLGIPYGWKLRPRQRDGYWTLTATGPLHPKDGQRRCLPCGHRSMQVRATELPLAVARMAVSVEFHGRDCNG